MSEKSPKLELWKVLAIVAPAVVVAGIVGAGIANHTAEDEGGRERWNELMEQQEQRKEAREDEWEAQKKEREERHAEMRDRWEQDARIRAYNKYDGEGPPPSFD